MRLINEVIIHCAATPPDWRDGQKTSTKVAEIKRWHVDLNGWRDIGYHFIIDRDGTVANGRPVTQTGAHVKGHNTGTIGICLMGGHGSAETDKFSDNFTPEQERALIAKIAEIQSIYGPLKVTGHNQYAAKACPGFNVPEWLGETSKEPEMPTLVTQPTAKPTRKVTAGGIAGLATVLVIAAVNRYAPGVGDMFGPEIETLAVAAVSWAASYMTKERG